MTVRFFPEVMAFIQEAEKRHPSQKISQGSKTQDGKPTYLDYHIKLPPRSLNEFSRWVYRFMGSAQFLIPAELAEKHKTWCAGIAGALSLNFGKQDSSAIFTPQQHQLSIGIALEERK